MPQSKKAEPEAEQPDAPTLTIRTCEVCKRPGIGDTCARCGHRLA